MHMSVVTFIIQLGGKYRKMTQNITYILVVSFDSSCFFLRKRNQCRCFGWNMHVSLKIYFIISVDSSGEQPLEFLSHFHSLVECHLWQFCQCSHLNRLVNCLLWHAGWRLTTVSSLWNVDISMVDLFGTTVFNMLRQHSFAGNTSTAVWNSALQRFNNILFDHY